MRVAVGLLRISRATQFPRRVIPSKIGLFDKIEDQHKSKQNSSFSVFLDRPCLKYRSSLPQSRHCKSYLLFLSFSVSLSLSILLLFHLSLSLSLSLSSSFFFNCLKTHESFHSFMHRHGSSIAETSVY